MMEFPRKTVADSILFTGVGLHSGEPVTLRIHPGSEGFRFRSGNQVFAATPDAVTDTQRCTRLGDVSTVEHVFSALAGLGFTDAEIEVEGGECPAAGGCAEEYVAGLRSVGAVEIGTLTVSGPFKRLFHVDDAVKVAVATGAGQWRYEYVCAPRWPGVQDVTFTVDPEVYAADIAPARTFAHADQVAQIQAAGLAKGLDASSALILGESGYENAARFEDEPARHKLLDLIGDLALSGIPVRALSVVGHRSGHRTNVDAARKLMLLTRIEKSP